MPNDVTSTNPLMARVLLIMVHAGGRPTSYTEVLGDEIASAIATSSIGLPRMCALPEHSHWPPPQTIMSWLYKQVGQFPDKYANAKRAQAEFLAAEILEISDESSNDYKETEDGREVFNGEAVARSRLRVDTRKWLAAKLLPRLYGERIQSEQIVTIKHEDALKELDD